MAHALHGYGKGRQPADAGKTTVEIGRLITDRTEEFLAHLPGIREGDSDSIHDARVVSRRLRELLSITPATHETRRAKEVLRQATQRLGIMRDLDSAIELLDRQNRLWAGAAMAIAAVRRQLLPLITLERRALVKAFERFDLTPLTNLTADASARWSIGLPSGRSEIRESVRARIGDRAQRLGKAIEHAAGLYFPNRLHGVRIAVKKLRYTAEAAGELVGWVPGRMARDLRKIQTSLGELRDAHLLRERLRTFLDVTVPTHEVSLLTGAVEADIARGHEAYLARRERLSIIVAVCEDYATRKGRWPFVIHRVA